MSNYIDKAAARRAALAPCEKCWVENNERPVVCDGCKLYGVAQAIDRLPAADVRPVVRGKWVNYGDEYRPDIKCCVCGQRKPILLGDFNFNFCPNCGAWMEESNGKG